jgi:hypothetical protein
MVGKCANASIVNINGLPTPSLLTDPVVFCIGRENVKGFVPKMSTLKLK